MGTTISSGLKFHKQNSLEMSPEDKRKSMYGDKKQGNNLVKKKFAHQTPQHTSYKLR